MRQIPVLHGLDFGAKEPLPHGWRAAAATSEVGAGHERATTLSSQACPKRAVTTDLIVHRFKWCMPQVCRLHARCSRQTCPKLIPA